MGKSKFELHKDRLATTDVNGNRIYIHPEDIQGKWRNRRTYFYIACILIYFLIPWISIGDKPAVLLDLPNREFTFFVTTFYAHDAPMLIFIFGGFVFSMALLTTLWGRIFCGWACPQTMFIDMVYSRIERLVEGNSRKRAELDAAPMRFNIICIRSLKWLLYLVVTFAIVYTFISYFVGIKVVFHNLFIDPKNHPTMNIVFFVSSTIILFVFGWFKEQFCIIACPYGRIQSIFQDEHSYIITYDEKRGEPRRSTDVTKEEGDCINCYHCVKVCPTGIDIRRGLQLECIGCTACIDSCDSIMSKLNKPLGLIRYDSETGVKGGITKILRGRSLIYFFLFMTCFIGFILTASMKDELSIMTSRGSNSPYQIIKVSGEEVLIVNHIKLNISKRGKRDIELSVELDKINTQDITMVAAGMPLKLSKVITKGTLFFKFPTYVLKDGKKVININFYSNVGDQIKLVQRQKILLLGPLK